MMLPSQPLKMLSSKLHTTPHSWLNLITIQIIPLRNPIRLHTPPNNGNLLPNSDSLVHRLSLLIQSRLHSRPCSLRLALLLFPLISISLLLIASFILLASVFCLVPSLILTTTLSPFSLFCFCLSLACFVASASCSMSLRNSSSRVSLDSVRAIRRIPPSRQNIYYIT